MISFELFQSFLGKMEEINTLNEEWSRSDASGAEG